MASTIVIDALPIQATEAHNKGGQVVRKLKRKRTVVVLVGVLALIAASAGLAAWLISSQGGGKSAIGAFQAPQVSAATDSAADTATNKCTPGSNCDVVLQVSNPNGALVLTGIVPGSLGMYELTSNSQCPATNLTVKTVTGLSVPVPAGSSTVIVPNGAMLASEAPTECQGAYISKPVKANFSTP